ncbi:uncharacterized protein PV09_06156 [Verruconis gallopava]|uniref:Zn(2)-C6 fungal-type domain-containing protein n=1 Tax=Verruconis gallopava TaxID=253628 RepID=A0A0D1YQ33_9PEZI|nr:uncharacterized protein PV09_06156 [Verruconis gallopava]KIW02722.1 hypothetical protein PV09_06156 [Verruconis gallopava]
MTIRSHHGCARCKSRRQKCDETKPSCGRCLSNGAQCEYKIVLKWNGRTPRVPSGSRNASNRFRSRSKSKTPPTIARNELVIQAVEPGFSLCEHPQRSLQPLELVPASSRQLLHHFTEKASMISSHPHIRDLICSQIIPYALQTPSLLYATMALSAINRHSLSDSYSTEKFALQPETAELIALSVRHLRQEVNELKGEARSTIIHTIRMLCTCEIFSGKADSSWRVHVEGAKAIMELGLQGGRPQEVQYASGPDKWLASRWFLSIEALTSLTERGLRNSEAEQSTARFGPKTAFGEDGLFDPDFYYDVYGGYSSDLNRVFRRIGSAALERRRLQDNMLPSESALGEEATFLEQSIHFMRKRDQDNGLRIPPELRLRDGDLHQLAACNEAYMFTALIHVHRRVRGLPHHAEQVQSCVKAIIAAAMSILPVRELSPWVLLTTPLFTAG